MDYFPVPHWTRSKRRPILWIQFVAADFGSRCPKNQKTHCNLLDTAPARLLKGFRFPLP